MVMHVDKIKLCKGDTPEYWMGRPEERLIDRIERGAFITLFDDTGRTRDAEIVNDIKNNVDKEEKRIRPKRNAQIPARYIQRIYAITDCSNVDVCCRDDFQEVMGFGADEVQQEGDDIESVEGRLTKRIRSRLPGARSGPPDCNNQ